MRLFHPLSPGLLSVHILIDFFFIFGFWTTPRSAQVLLLVLPSEIILGRLKGTLSDAEDGTRQGKRPVSCAVTLAPIDYFFPVGGYWLEIWGLGVSAFLRLIWKSTRVEKKKTRVVCLFVIFSSSRNYFKMSASCLHLSCFPYHHPPPSACNSAFLLRFALSRFYSLLCLFFWWNYLEAS